jgi:hypothetical protein
MNENKIRVSSSPNENTLSVDEINNGFSALYIPTEANNQTISNLSYTNLA